MYAHFKVRKAVYLGGPKDGTAEWTDVEGHVLVFPEIRPLRWDAYDPTEPFENLAPASHQYNYVGRTANTFYYQYQGNQMADSTPYE